jgi:hypothetical protein
MRYVTSFFSLLCTVGSRGRRLEHLLVEPGVGLVRVKEHKRLLHHTRPVLVARAGSPAQGREMVADGHHPLLTRSRPLSFPRGEVCRAFREACNGVTSSLHAAPPLRRKGRAGGALSLLESGPSVRLSCIPVRHAVRETSGGNEVAEREGTCRKREKRA